MNETTTESYRKIKYNASRRHDGLEYLEMTPVSMLENFVDRDDLLHSRIVTFYPRGEPPAGVKEGRYRIVMVILKRMVVRLFL